MCRQTWSAHVSVALRVLDLASDGRVTLTPLKTPYVLHGSFLSIDFHSFFTFFGRPHVFC